ncbi:hypothetical protein A2U01_0106915, partial [Trifolium medium]|nr:hypothetical protein [Trifolium medium]
EVERERRRSKGSPRAAAPVQFFTGSEAFTGGLGFRQGATYGVGQG